MRVHVVGLPHTHASIEYEWCAYTEKVRKWVAMLHQLGHDVVLYAGDESDVPADVELVPIVTRAEQRAWWPTWNLETDYWPGTWNATDPWWALANARAVAAISARAEPLDVLGIIAGTAQAPMWDALPELRPLEWGIGYKGAWSPFRVYESHAWAHHVGGRAHDDLGHYYHWVVPNSFEVERFADVDGLGDDGYLLYLGRMVENKGLAVVGELVKRGHRVVTAGQGHERVYGAEHRGLVRGVVKAELLARARAVLVPTLYVEPFGGVAVEAQLAGAPVITTDWGAFTETVDHGRAGYRCRTVAEFLGAVDLVDDLDRSSIQKRARERWSIEAAGRQYDAVLTQLDELAGDGWYTEAGPLRDTLAARY